MAYVNLGGTFYYLISVLDGYSRFLVHWELRTSMTTMDVEIVLQRARERFPAAKPRIISDNGSAFIAKDFKIFIREAGMTHVRTSAFYPQSNGKIERWHRTVKNDAIRRYEPSNPDQACRIVGEFVEHSPSAFFSQAFRVVEVKDGVFRRPKLYPLMLGMEKAIAPQPRVQRLSGGAPGPS